ncbi:MAG: DNA gyrase inhibitor YacG [Planctomycetes bacterium]|nr:DNA gyrase inhibitor YacG [Planctomycetota bacterium]
MISPQTCPICDKALPATAAESKLFPFCSERCRQVDLYRWMTGRYAIVEPLDPDELEGLGEDRPVEDDDEAGGQ